jgi:hypothetical protein
MVADERAAGPDPIMARAGEIGQTEGVKTAACRGGTECSYEGIDSMRFKANTAEPQETGEPLREREKPGRARVENPPA